jgi:hypothetical protein
VNLLAIKKVEIKPPDGGYADVLYPKTSADIVSIADSGNRITATDVEGALQELSLPSNLLSKLLTVDGSGSGLDADLLDGKDGDRFIFGANSSGTTSWSTGIDNIDKSGFYYVVTNLTNTPESSNGYVIHTRFHTDSTHAMQIFVPAGQSTAYFRRKVNTWQPWVSFGGTRSTTGGANLNTLTETGIYEVSNPVNGPFAGMSWMYLEVIKHNSTGFVMQVAHDFWTNRSWQRRQVSGTWEAWGSTSNTFVQSTAPTNPVLNDIWIDTSV